MPVHPPLVHFPIAMLTVAWAMLIIRYTTGDPKWDRMARPFQVIGVASLPLVLISAVIDTRGFNFITQVRWDAPLIWHAIAGVLTASLFAGHFLWRRRYQPEEFRGTLAVLDVGVASVGVWVLLTAGLLAAEMVYAGA